MSDKEDHQREERSAPEESSRPYRSRSALKRRLIISGLVVAGLFLFAFLAVIVAFQTGYVDSLIRNALLDRFSKFGIKADIGKLQTTLFPTTAKLQNLVLRDEQSGEELAKIDQLNIDLTISNILALRAARTITVNSTDVQGLEVWVRFDKQGHSNFSNLHFKFDEDPNLKVSFASVNFRLQDAIVHYGDVSRRIGGEAKNISVVLDPVAPVQIEPAQYRFDMRADNSTFVYEGTPLEPVNISAHGTGSREGATVDEWVIDTPIGKSTLTGTIQDWENLRYQFHIVSSVDLTQTSTLLPVGRTLRGTGQFEGDVTGTGENYQIQGTINSDALAADNIRLKALNVSGSGSGQGSNYEANGKAVAELLTAGDFEINWIQILGQVRGTGSDFRWFGELSAKAAKFDGGTIMNLVFSDVVAEYQDEKFSGDVGKVSASSFRLPDAELQNLVATKPQFSSKNGVTDVTLPNARAGKLKTANAQLSDINAGDVKIRNQGQKTDVSVARLQAGELSAKDTHLKNVRSNNVKVAVNGNDFKTTAPQVQADQLNAAGTKVNSLNARNVEVDSRAGQTLVTSDTLNIGSLAAEGVVLGSLNIAGVRLSIRSGRVEGTSQDISAGDVTLTKSANTPDGGKFEAVKFAKPVFVLEPSGRYRASADLSLGGGVVGSIHLGAASAKAVITSSSIELSDLSADMMDGKITGNAVIGRSAKTQSHVNAQFDNVDLAKILTLAGGQVVPLEGKTNGRADLTFAGTNYHTVSGTVNADFVANAGDIMSGLIPLNGTLSARATNGLFNIDSANFKTEKSTATASGTFDLNGYNSDLSIALNSGDASEVQRLATSLQLSEELNKQLASYGVELAGNLTFNGKLTGKVTDPTIDGRVSLDRLNMKGQEVGAVAAVIKVSPLQTEIAEGSLKQTGGGSANFDLIIPRTGTDNISVSATLTNLNTGSLFAALPIDEYLPSQLRDLNASTSGKIDLSGLPNAAAGSADLTATQGTLAGIAFDSLASRFTIQDRMAKIEKLELYQGDGSLVIGGNYALDSSRFDVNLQATNIQVQSFRKFLSDDPNFPIISGLINAQAKGTGELGKYETYDINFSGSGTGITVNENQVGSLAFAGKTVNQILTAAFTADLSGQQQVINATLNFGDENLPLNIESSFNQTELAPFVALLQPPESVTVRGTATGKVVFNGNLMARDESGKLVFTTDNLKGLADFSEFGLLINDTPFNAAGPLVIHYTSSEVTIDNVRFAGAGSNVVVNGTKALNEKGINNLTVDGKVNLRILDALSRNTFFAGLADVSVRLTGNNAEARLSGEARTQNSTVSTIVSNERLYFDRIRGRILFNADQAQLVNMSGYLGGGRVRATGGAVIEGLKLRNLRLDLQGTDVTAPLPRGFTTTGDAEVTITSERRGDDYNTIIAGTIYGKRAVYTKDIDLADFLGARREGTISEGSSTQPLLGIPQLDLRLEGRDALIVKNNIADMVASVSLRVTGDVDNALLSGRITATRGTLFFRNDRYEIQQGSLEFPASYSDSATINLQAESEIQGYQVFASVAGSLSDLDALNVVLRSSPSLPQADVVSLVTTGGLSNTDTGIPTLAQSGINTATKVLADTLINNPARKATDKLFGLNRFEIDPILSGRRLTPTARLTVGRQINKNLAITFSTNLSQERNQVLALEYRVSNRLSFVAQYEQNATENVTRHDNNFSFEIRLRKRF
jgi:translocation and assembly module TamB